MLVKMGTFAWCWCFNLNLGFKVSMIRYASTLFLQLPSQDERESTFEIEVQHFEIEFLQFRKVLDSIFFHSTGADEIDEELEFSEDISISAASEGFTKDESLINEAQFKADYIENLDK